MRSLSFGLLLLVSAHAWADSVNLAAEPMASVGSSVAAGAKSALAALTAEQKRLGFVFKGQLLGKQAGLDTFCREMALSEAELAAVIEGVGHAARGEELPFAIAPLVAPAQEHFDRRVAARKALPAAAPGGAPSATVQAVETTTVTNCKIHEGVDAPPMADAGLSVEQQRQGLVLQGYFAGKQVGVPVFFRELGLDGAELAAVLEGFGAAARGVEPADEIAPMLDSLGVYFDERSAGRRRAWLEENRLLLARLAADEAVVKHETGLRSQVLKAGNEEKPTARSTVQVRFTGRLCDGTVFDSSYLKLGDRPIEFALATAVLGWHQGLQLIGKGGKIRLWIPPMLAYGPQAHGPIPAGSVLEFEAELVDFR